MYSLRERYPKNIIISYFNINSIQIKLNDLEILISASINILCIAESKLNGSFLNSEIAFEWFKKPYRPDVTASSQGLLIYVKPGFTSKIINHYDFQKDIQCTAKELNVANKYLLAPNCSFAIITL